MKRLPLVILFFAVLVAIVTGCSRAPRYDARLVAADSLIRSAPDSALALVEGVCRDSLTAECDRAYRDLLLTQARYRCYVTATSDSDINRALAYYRAHQGEREKLTRAYIYKGAVMEELDHPDSAMCNYKQAEHVADTADHFNLGYTKMRIGSLYQSQFSMDSAAIIRFKDAIRYFKIIRDTNYLISCYGDLGAVCGMRYPDSAELFLNKAIRLALLSKSPKYYTYKSKLAGVSYYKGNYQQANQQAMDVFNHGKEFSNESQFYYYAIFSFLRLGLLDSAKYIFRNTPPPVDAVDSMNHYRAIAELAKARMDFKTYADNMVQSAKTTVKIHEETNEKELIATEFSQDKNEIEKQNDLMRKRNISLLAFLSLLTVIILVLIWRVMRMYSIIKNYEQEKNTIKKELDVAIAELKNRQESEKSSVSKLVWYRLSALNELSQTIRIKTYNDDKTKKIIPLSSLLSQIHERREFLAIKLSDKFWEKMKLSVDGEYKGIMSYIERHYPNLSDSDLKLLCLYCANLSPQIIRICMNFNHPKTSSNYRQKIIKNKMGLDMTLEMFIEKYLNGDFKQ